MRGLWRPALGKGSFALAQPATAAVCLALLEACSGLHGSKSSVASAPAAAADAAATLPLDFAAIDTAEAAMFAALPQGTDQLNILCTRDQTAPASRDAINNNFCHNNAPVLNGLADVLRIFNLTLTPASQNSAPQLADSTGTTASGTSSVGTNSSGSIGFGTGPATIPSITPVFTVEAQSASLVGRYVSAINPRTAIFSAPTGGPTLNYVGITFVRGEQAVEITAYDPGALPEGSGINFYFIKFQQACNAQPGGCTNEDLYTDKIEKNWTGYTLYEDTDLVDTIMDCTHCHQPGGPNANKFLRMQEITAPFTHFFDSTTAGGQALLADFHAAHGTSEDYGGVPANLIDQSKPDFLADFVNNNAVYEGFPSVAGVPIQPNSFASAAIEAEVAASSPGQPADNSQPGSSATWNEIFNAAQTGQFIAVPYHDVKDTDPALLPTYIQAVQQYLAGAPAVSIPDMRTVVRADQAVDMGFAPAAGLSGTQILEQVCTPCHNSNLDQTLSKEKFNADLSTIGAAERAVAVSRINLPLTDPKRMPPPRFMVLSPAQIAALAAVLGN